MNTNARILLDQADYADANYSLEAEVTVLEAQLRAMGHTPPARPATNADVIAHNDTLTAHRAVLIGQKSAGPKTAPKAAQPKTLTERVLAAKGVKSLEELNAIMAQRKPQPGD